MQKYNEITADLSLEESRELLINNDKTAISHHAGIAFPTENLIVGMECYRTDEDEKYRLKSIKPSVWEKTSYSHPDKHPASMIVFTDNQTFQQKLDAGTLKGAKGDIGAQGIQGLKGDTGAAGTKGTTGPAGAQGAKGDTGAIGTQGKQGIQGIAGPTGAMGPAGPKGATGPQGPAGTTSYTATAIGQGGNAGIPMTFNWSGQGGQPTWLWGGNDGRSHNVYNPSNFKVSYAASAGLLSTLNSTNVTVTASDQQALNPTISSSFSTSQSVTLLNQNTGLAAGTYTLQNLLQQIVKRTHSHSLVSRNGSNCNCACNCDCSTDSDSDG